MQPASIRVHSTENNSYDHPLGLHKSLQPNVVRSCPDGTRPIASQVNPSCMQKRRLVVRLAARLVGRPQDRSNRGNTDEVVSPSCNSPAPAGLSSNATSRAIRLSSLGSGRARSAYSRRCSRLAIAELLTPLSIAGTEGHIAAQLAAQFTPALLALWATARTTAAMAIRPIPIPRPPRTNCLAPAVPLRSEHRLGALCTLPAGASAPGSSFRRSN